MIQVKIRHAYDGTSVPLCQVPFGTDMHAVLEMLHAWGVTTEYGDVDETVAQWVVTPSEAYFEIVLGGED